MADHSRCRATMRSVDLTRRAVLAGLGAGAAAMSLPSLATGPNVTSKGRTIDVHAHYYPPALKVLGMPTPMNAWSLERHMEEMDKAGVGRTMLSLTTPGITQTGSQGRSLLSASNVHVAVFCCVFFGCFCFFV